MSYASPGTCNGARCEYAASTRPCASSEVCVGATCLWDDASLSGLTIDPGTLRFQSGTSMYAVALGTAVTSLRIRASVAQPTRASIRINGSAVASGVAHVVGLSGVSTITIAVTAESGRASTTTIVLTFATSQQAYVKASNADGGDAFGLPIALSGDGSTLAVGAFNEDGASPGVNGDQSSNGAAQSGAVYVFVRIAGQWTQQAYLKPAAPSADDNFGSSVGLSDDGASLVVGAPGESSAASGINGNQSNEAATGSGAAYVFTRTGSTWAQEAYLKASNPDIEDGFGFAVSISADGATVAVSALAEDSAATGVNGNGSDNTRGNSGAAYVFTRAGSTWSQQAYLKASNTSAQTNFGYAIALSGNGNFVAVGAIGEASNAVGVNGDQTNTSAINAGAVYVFTRSGNAWSQQAYVKASNTELADSFGFALAINAAGDTLVVGAPYEDSPATTINGAQGNGATASGAAYVFVRSGAVWSQQAYLKAGNAGVRDNFGSGVAVSGDGDLVVVGARAEDSDSTGVNGVHNEASTDSGAVYLFTRSGLTWSPGAFVKASNTAPNASFGAVAVSADASTFAVGAQGEASAATGIDGNQADRSATGAGAVYVFAR